MIVSASLLAAVALLPLVQADTSLRLHHRVYHPTLLPDAPFAERAILALSGSRPAARTHLVPADSLSVDLLEFAGTIRDTDGAFYQLALEHPGDVDPSQWHVSTVKACHLPLSTSEEIILHLAQDGTPYALDYFVGPIPRDGACPRRRRRKPASSGSSETSAPAALTHVSNTTISLVHPRFPPLPQLRAPPPLTPEGTPAVPIPEKTFLQKYWMYLAVAVVALLISPAGEEEGGAKPAPAARR